MMSEEGKYKVEDTSKARLRAKPAAVAEFIESGFGLSIHWGLYSVNGRGEWVMHTESIPFDTYRKRMEEFNPVRFDAEECPPPSNCQNIRTPSPLPLT
jgi:hypothetical protein